MKYEIKITSQFKKDIKSLMKQNINLDDMYMVIEKLANDEILEAKYRDHSLSGDFKDCRECHIKPDLLLIYMKSKDVMILSLVRAGSHSELF